MISSGEVYIPSQNRAHYETPWQRIVERRVADRVEIGLPGLTVQRMPEMAPYDYTARRGVDIVGIFDIKCREYPMWKMDRWGGFYMSERKFLQILRMSSQLRINGVVVVRDKDNVIWWHRVDGGFDGRKWAGREDRDDPLDMEWCVMLKQFRFVRTTW